MKKNILKLFLVLVAALINNISVKAQQDLTLYNMEVVPQRMYTNPALFPSYSKVNIGLPMLSSTYFNFSNSGFKYSDLVRRRSDDSLYVDYNNMLSKLAKNNYFTTAVRIDLLSFGFAVKKNYFSFNATEKIDVRFRYPKDFFEFIGKGNADMLGKEVNFNFGINATHYREYGLGYSRKINDKLTVGGKFKYLYGMENIATERSDMAFTTDPTDYHFTVRSDIKINTSGLDSSAINGISDDPKAYLFKRKNTGMGVDLGATYQLTEKISFSASMIDLGYIKWKDDSHTTIQTHDKNARYNYRGVDFNDLFSEDTTTNNDPFQAVVDTLNKTLKLDSTHTTYTTRLSTQIYAGANYNFTEKTKAGILFYGQFFDKKIHPALALSFNQRLGRWLNYSLSYSMYNRSYNNIGCGIGLNLGPVQYYIVSDNVLGALFPQNTKNLHLHFGMNLTFGRKLDKDKDGISDKKDKCPEIPGIKEFNGCPDKDHDHIADAEDMCPNDSGSIELKGCPDKDGDKIIDLTDSCPDIAGLVEFNGCPDKDGDKIMDKKDACPDEAGTVEMKGCPDKDGDKVKDSEDACPDKSGPETNKGCPEKTLNLINSKGDVLNFATVRKDGSFAFDYLPLDKDALFKLTNTTDTSLVEVKVVVAGAAKVAYKDNTGVYRFKIEEPKPVNTAPVAVKLDAKEAEILKKAFNNLEFNTGKDVIKNESFSSLDELAGLLAKKPTWNLKVSGHTDNVGNPKANLLLSQKRAEAVKKYLVSKGIAESRFKVEWFGGKKPIATNKTEAGRQQNRRVEMMITE